MATRAKSEEVDLYDILKNEFLNYAGASPRGSDETTMDTLSRLRRDGYPSRRQAAVVSAERLKTTGSIRGGEIHTLIPKGVRYQDEEVGVALTRLLTEGYIRIVYRRGLGLFATGSSTVEFICTGN